MYVVIQFCVFSLDTDLLRPLPSAGPSASLPPRPLFFSLHSYFEPFHIHKQYFCVLLYISPHLQSTFCCIQCDFYGLNPAYSDLFML